MTAETALLSSGAETISVFAGEELGSIYASRCARLLLQPLLGNDAKQTRVGVGIWLALSLFLARKPRSMSRLQ